MIRDEPVARIPSFFVETCFPPMFGQTASSLNLLWELYLGRFAGGFSGFPFRLPELFFLHSELLQPGGKADQEEGHGYDRLDNGSVRGRSAFQLVSPVCKTRIH